MEVMGELVSLGIKLGKGEMSFIVSEGQRIWFPFHLGGKLAGDSGRVIIWLGGVIPGVENVMSLFTTEKRNGV